ncbi:HTTM domain-containing protein [Schumannella luteola]
MSALERFDRWAAAGPFTATDLARFRILFSVGSLLTLFDFTWFSHFPPSMFLPPPGPFQLFAGFPPEPVAIAMEIGVALSFACLAFGYRTTVAGWAASILMVIGFGFTYSLGKIDHPILFAIAPALLGFTGWGSELSVDRMLGRTTTVRVWPLRLLALVIGIAFFTAGLAKLRSGWLSPATQAVRREFLNFYTSGNNGGVLPWLVTIDAPWAWELLDWLVVALELGIIVCVVSWTSFRIAIALATLFHLGVLVLLTISFGFNVLVYGAFVEWRRVPVRAPAWVARTVRTWYPVLIPAAALPVWAISHAIPHTAQQSGWIVVLGSGIAAGYLIALVVARVRRPQRTPA